MKKEQIEIAKKIYLQLVNLGLTGQTLLLAMAQMAHETDGFKSPVFLRNNNIGGIKWKNQKNATKGSCVGREYNDAPSCYARFNTIQDSVNEWHRLINVRYPKALKSITAFDYASALKEKGYYSAPLALYSTALKRWITTLNKIDFASAIEEKKKAIDNNYFIYRLDNFIGDFFKK